MSAIYDIGKHRPGIKDRRFNIDIREYLHTKQGVLRSQGVLEYVLNKTGSSWPFFVTKLLSKSLWESKSFKKSYQSLKIIDILQK